MDQNRVIRTETLDLQDKRRLADSNRWKVPVELRCLKPLRKQGKKAYREQAGPLSSPCWVWQGSLNSRGYALRGTKKDGLYLVHRRVVEEATGCVLPAGIQVHHICEVKACVNPLHLISKDPVAHAREHYGTLARDVLLTHIDRLGVVGRSELEAFAGETGIQFGTLYTAGVRLAEHGRVVREDGKFYSLERYLVAA